MIRYRVGARPRLRAFCSRYVFSPKRIERRRMWSARLSCLTLGGKVRTAAFKARMLAMLDNARAGIVTSIADRVSGAIADQALRAAWRPVQGDA